MCLKKKKKVHESSSIAGTVWDKRSSKTTKIHLHIFKKESNEHFLWWNLQKKNTKTNVEHKGSVSGQLFIINPLMKPSKLNRARKKNARYVADDE